MDIDEDTHVAGGDDNEEKGETEDSQHNEREEEEKEGEDAANPNNEPEKRGGQYSKNPKGSVVAKPTTILFYPELWHKLLDLTMLLLFLRTTFKRTRLLPYYVTSGR